MHTIREDEDTLLRKAQEDDPLWKMVRKWVDVGRAPPLVELRGNEREVLTLRGQFSTELFQIVNGILMFQKHADRNKEGDAHRICLPRSRLQEAFELCHSNSLAGHRGINGTTTKFNRSFYMLSTGEKIQELIRNCVPCMAKIRSLPERRGEHVPSLTGYVGEKSFIDLVSFAETPRENRYILTVMDGFSRYAAAYPLPNKEAVTVAR